MGLNASTRDATLLRSQLEPFSTTQLQLRLIKDFGQNITDIWERAEVMKKILNCYLEEGLMVKPKSDQDNLNVELDK